MVPKVGVEPTKDVDFESTAYASSAIRANSAYSAQNSLIYI